MLKLPLGLAMFEGTTLTVRSSARRAAELSARAVAGQGDPALMTEVQRAEWMGLWIIMARGMAVPAAAAQLAVVTAAVIRAEE